MADAEYAYTAIFHAPKKYGFCELFVSMHLLTVHFLK